MRPSRRADWPASASSRWKDTNWSPSRLTDGFAFGVATAGGAGLVPVAPGTAGSLLAALLLWLLPFSNLSLGVTLVSVVLAGIWAGGRIERLSGREDPGLIVIDEVAGMMLSVLVLPRTLEVVLVAFFCFRVLDIVKPFPASQAQSLPGGFGVMMDDLIAGAYTLLLVAASRAVFGWPQ
ncbi:MAG: phosphatidylglycerophosphatase A [Candidatus Rokubacteria bacterium]|nr:phosphatidylglycerophosphatase A [Candidatus Rokubacteria bacterium]MBI2554535.1 phosphatidylglycerophosphatase A [Candidatus Rokubacteria bacterium]